MWPRARLLVMGLAWLLLLAWGGPGVWAQEHRVLAVQVDGSGSMTGFQKTGELENLLRRLSELARTHQMETQVKVFLAQQPTEIKWLDWQGFLDGKSWGRYSPLDLAFAQGQAQSPLVIFITDNIISTGTDQSIIRLFERFKDPSLVSLHALPLLLDFDGWLYGDEFPGEELNSVRGTLVASNPRGRFSDWNQTKVWYRGKRGLICYLAAEGEAPSSSYHAFLADLRRENPHLILVKPLTDQEIRLDAYLEPRQAGETQPELDLAKEESLLLTFTLGSRLPHLDVGLQTENRPSLSGNSSVQLQEDDAKIFFRSLGADDQRETVRIEPPTLQGRLEQNTSQSYRYQASILIGPFDVWPHSWEEIKAMARLTPVPASCTINIRLAIPRSQLSFTPSFRDELFSKDPYKIDRVYAPHDLIQYLAPDLLTVNLPHDICFQGKPGSLSVALLGGLLLLALAVVGALAWVVFFIPTNYVLTPPPKQAPVSARLLPFYLGRAAVLTPEKKIVAHLQRFITRHRLQPAEGYRRPGGDQQPLAVGPGQEITFEGETEHDRWIFKMVR